jgi:hypothetical protein
MESEVRAHGRELVGAQVRFEMQVYVRVRIREKIT